MSNLNHILLNGYTSSFPYSTHGGGAAIVDPFGEVLARSEPSVEDISISADLHAERLEEARRKVNFILRSRRPELYGELTEMI